MKKIVILFFLKVFLFIPSFLLISSYSLAENSHINFDHKNNLFINKLCYKDLNCQFSTKLIPCLVDNFIYLISSEGIIVKINIESQKCIWKKKTPYSFVVGAVANENNIVTITDNGKILSFDNEGNQKWSFDIFSKVNTLPVIYENSIFIRTEDLSFYALNIDTGKILWSLKNYFFPISLHVESPILCLENSIVTYSFNNNLVSINTDNGFINWKTPISNDNYLSGIIGSPLSISNNIYFINDSGYITCFDILNKVSSVWDMCVKYPIGIAAHDSFIYVLNNEGELYKINSIDGNIIWKKVITRDHSITKPIIKNHMIILSDSSGYLSLISCHDGSTLFKYKISSSSILPSIILSDTGIVINTSDDVLFFIDL